MTALTPKQVREAIACGIGSMRERESLGILPKRYAEAQTILRRLLESGFVEAAMRDSEFATTGKFPSDDWDGNPTSLVAYRRLQGEK